MQILLENEAKALLRKYNVPTTTPQIVQNLSEASSVLQQLRGPAALKVMSREIIHKARAGCVALNVTSDNLEATYHQILSNAQSVEGAHIEGVLIEPMVDRASEIIIGVTLHPTLGPVVMFGLGGGGVEELAQVSFALAPLNHQKTVGLLDSIDVTAGAHTHIRQKLYEVLLSVGGEHGLFFNEHVIDMDINPIIIHENSIIAVDSYVSIDPGMSQQRPAQLLNQNLSAHTMDAIETLFKPSGVIVVGASTNPQKLGFKTVRGLVDYGFPGPVYCIHPTAKEIYGCPSFESISEVPKQCDRATVIVRADRVPTVLKELSSKGVKVAQVVSAGFGEWDQAGEALEQEVKKVICNTGIRVAGPNTVGMFSASGRVSFTARRFTPRGAGTIGFISQSGTFTLDAVQRSKVIGLPLDMALSAGNCLDLTMADYLLYLNECAHIKIIGMYIESEENSGALFRALETIKKPVVLLKGGMSSSGAQAALSHTGALSSDPKLWRQIAMSSGATVLANMDDLLDTFTMLVAAGCKRPGNKAALFTSGGGVSVSAADAADKHSVCLVELSADTNNALGKYLKPGTTIKNPIDIPVWGLKHDGEYVFDRIVTLLDKDDAIDTIMICVEMGSIFSYTENDKSGISELNKITDSITKAKFKKPLILILRSTGDQTQDNYVRSQREELLKKGIAVFPNEYRAIRALGHASNSVTQHSHI